MSVYAFPGFTKFLEAAAKRIGHPEAEAPARRIVTLSALANLCAQAGESGPEDARAILVKGAEFRDQLHAAYEAAELMLSDVQRALGLDGQPHEANVDVSQRKRLPNWSVVASKSILPS